MAVIICAYQHHAYYTKDKHKKLDDRPFGGGPGMVMNAQPILDCVESIKNSPTQPSPSGRATSGTLSQTPFPEGEGLGMGPILFKK